MTTVQLLLARCLELEQENAQLRADLAENRAALRERQGRPLGIKNPPPADTGEGSENQQLSDCA